MPRADAGRAMTYEEAVLDAARTRRHWKETGAFAKDIGPDLCCAPNWTTIEMEVRARLLLAHLRRPLRLAA